MAPRKKPTNDENKENLENKIFESDNLKINKKPRSKPKKYSKKFQDALNKIKDPEIRAKIEKAVEQSNIDPENIVDCGFIDSMNNNSNSTDYTVMGYGIALTKLASTLTDRIGITATENNKWALLTCVSPDMICEIIFKAIKMPHNWLEFCRLGLHVESIKDNIADIQETDFTQIYIKNKLNDSKHSSEFEKAVMALINSCTEAFWNILTCEYFLTVSKNFTEKIEEIFKNKDLKEATTLCSKSRFAMIAKIDTLLNDQIEKDRMIKGTFVNSLSPKAFDEFLEFVRFQIKEYINDSSNFDATDMAVTTDDAIAINSIIDKIYYKARFVYQDYLAHVILIDKNKKK